MPSSTCPDRHRRRRLALKGEARLSGDKLTQAQLDLLMSKVSEDAATGCWLWQATTNAAGYGILVWATKCYRAHKLMLEWATGQAIPANMDVDHLCECRRCVNPSHLQAVSHAENLRRIRARDAAPLPFAWRAARDAAWNAAHLDAIQAEKS